MATHENTADVDTLFGKADVADLFLMGLGFIGSADRVNGGTGPVKDAVELQGGGTVPAMFGQSTT